jgi:hypothetical protein
LLRSDGESADNFKRNSGMRAISKTRKPSRIKSRFRKLYGNHPFYALVTDKFHVSAYAPARVGAQQRIALLGAYDRLHESDLESLPT